MSVGEPTSKGAISAGWLLRAHRALMPDYNRKAAVFWYAGVLLGGALLVYCVHSLAARPPRTWGEVALGVAVAMLAAMFPVRIPRSKNSLAAGEIFIFLLLLLHGPPAATLASAAEAAVGAWRSSKRWSARIASPAMAALAMFVSGTLLEALRGALQSLQLTNGGLLIAATMVFALVYFVCNTMLITAVHRLKRNEGLQLGDLVGVFGWVGIIYTGSAAVAALLYLAFRESGFGVVVAVVPIIGLLMMTLHYFFRQQEANEAVLRTASEAATREAEAAARHLAELQASERRFHSAFTHASIGMALLSIEGRVLQGNAALHAFLGKDEQSLAGCDVWALLCEEDAGLLREGLKRLSTDETESFAMELRFLGKDGAVLWAATHGSDFADPSSGAPCLILQVQDITARRQAEAGLQHIAFHDALTGLPNRRRFHECLTAAIERANSGPNHRFALMFIDFDRFKLINDSLGHNAGDEFLMQATRRLQQNVRPNDILARLGGDEFAILVVDQDREQHAVLLAERLLRAMQQPFEVSGTEVIVSASIGITFSKVGYKASDEALRDADIAMYKAKESGKARYAIFDVGLHAEVTQRLRLEGDLRNAILGGKLSVVYQPVFDLRSGDLIAFEALSRWDHPELGSLEPNLFIPIAEECGLIVPLTDMVLQRACHQLRDWHQKDAVFSDLRMHVNISAKDVGHESLVARVTQVLVGAHLQPHHLTLELTENILMEQIENALPTLAKLRELGVGLSVDDFGTGYSSLAHLSSLPIDTLKVDRSFVHDLKSGSNETKVIRAIVHLGTSLDKSVVAEGIEDSRQLAQLREMGCVFGQGFLLGRPQASEAIDALLDRVVAERTQGARRRPTSGEFAALLH